MSFVGNLLGFPAVEKFWKYVKNWQSYRQWVWCTTFLGHSVEGLYKVQDMEANQRALDIWQWTTDWTQVGGLYAAETDNNLQPSSHEGRIK